MQKSFLRCLLLLVVYIPGPSDPLLAQTKPARVGTSPLCTRDNAFEMIKQQVEFSKPLPYDQRISVLIRAAELLWPYQQDKAREFFTEAFELALRTEVDGVDAPQRPQSLILRMQVPDQRYIVIRAVAKRDSAWAKELIKQMMKEETERAEIPPARDSFNNRLTADRLFYSAWRLLDEDINAALELARVGLNYPASSMMTHFLYRLAEINQQAADQFYAQALRIYGDKPMREFLYLQAYPFAMSESLDTPVFSFYQVPANFVTTKSLQRRFMQTMLRRAQQALEEPIDAGDMYREQDATLAPAAVHLLQALMRIEPQVRALLPDLLAPLTQAREKILVTLSVDVQKRLLQPGEELSTKPEQTFAERIEAAEKVADLDERDGLIIPAVFGSQKESLTSVAQAIDKISDSNLRAHSTEWFYFYRAIAAIKDKQFGEAERLISKVEGQEQRAFLLAEIAKGLLSRSDAQTHAREVLEQAITEAKRAGVTIFAARTLLTAVSLYTKIELSRAVEVLADAINCVNRIEAPDFVRDDQSVEKRPERKGKGGRYEGEYVFRFYMPGLDPESVFREMAKLDFDTSLAQSSTLKDKFQRAMSTLALADTCLQQTQPQPKEKPKKK